MNLNIDGKFSITSDSRQYILQEKMKVLEGENKGKEYQVSLGYYSSITNALQAYQELQIRNSGVTSIEGLYEKIAEVKTTIEKFLEGN